MVLITAASTIDLEGKSEKLRETRKRIPEQCEEAEKCFKRNETHSTTLYSLVSCFLNSELFRRWN